jgi:LCP family protein required for cell wall assembly
MSDFKNNLIKDNSLSEKFEKCSQKKLNWKNFFIYFSLAGIISFVVILLAFVYAPNIILSKKNNALKKIEKENSLLNQFYRFIPAGDFLIKKDQNRVNILLLGIGGDNHPGGLLADTTMLISLNFKTKEMAMVSIPRDLFVPISNYGWQKINTLNSFGETEKFGNGAIFTAENLSQLFEIPIHYYIRIDFEGFKKIIDDFGGLDIYVEKTFHDSLHQITFKQGWQHFDSKKALTFARSRHGNNGEGSDFARAKRQQKIIVAFKGKFLSLSTLTNPQKISAIYEMLKNHLKTNLNVKEIISLLTIFKNMDIAKIQHFVFDTSNYLYPEKTIAGAFILNPKAGNFKEMSLLIQNIFDKNFVGKTDFVVINKPRLIIQNGTDNPGLANKVAQDLKNLNYKIIKINNADHQNYEKTIIYDLCFDQKSEALVFLQKKFNATVIPNAFRFLNSSPSAEEIATVPSNVFPKNIKNLPSTDFLIILGKNILK